MTLQALKITVIAMVISAGAFLPSAAVRADDYSKEWAPPVGSAMPAITAQDHTGTARNFDNLAGKNGILIFLNRSADW